jgi:DNA polymerase III epsilon subunit-like protein
MIFADTETTGLLKPDAITLNLQPYIIELYAVKLTDDLEFVSEIDTLIKPPVQIPAHITKINGIDDGMVTGSPKFINIYQQLVDMFLGETVIVGHNISFDLGMLYCELARHSYEFHFPWPQTWICTVEKAMPIENRRLRLSQLHEKATGKPHEGSHRAKSDVQAVIRCYSWLKEQGLL